MNSEPVKSEIDSYIFGGTLDPFHQGHLGVILEILAPNRLVVIAPTAQNPLKPQSSTAIALRREMVRLVLAAEKIGLASEPRVPGIFLSDFDYVYAVDFVAHWRSKVGGNLHWVVGPDLADQPAEWKDWSTLGVPVFVAGSHANNLHAVDVRQGQQPLHPALEEFARVNRLYGRGS